MKLLIVAATENELDIVKKNIQPLVQQQVDFLVTGIGMVHTTFHLCKKLYKQPYDLVMNVGLAGALNKKLQLGEVVEVYADQFPELGAEDGDNFLSLSELELSNANEYPFENNWIYAGSDFNSSLPKVKGITVNTVHGNEIHIEKLKQRVQADVESMEGAAFMYVCKMQELPCIQIRSISNYVERRDKENWKLFKALNNLSIEVNKFLKII